MTARGAASAIQALDPPSMGVHIVHPSGASGLRSMLALATVRRPRQLGQGVLGVLVGPVQEFALILENEVAS